MVISSTNLFYIPFPITYPRNKLYLGTLFQDNETCEKILKVIPNISVELSFFNPTDIDENSLITYIERIKEDVEASKLSIEEYTVNYSCINSLYFKGFKTGVFKVDNLKEHISNCVFFKSSDYTILLD